MHDKDDITVVFSFIFLLLGVVGNIAVIIYNICLNHNKTVSSWLVTHLAVADFFACLTIYILKTVKLFLDEDEVIAEAIIHSTFYVSLFLSITILLVITIDKHLFIAKPLKYPVIVTKRKTFTLLGCIWVTAVLQLPPLYIAHIHNEGDTPEWLKISYAILYFLCIVAIIILNYKIFKIVKEQRKRIAQEMALQPRYTQSNEIQTSTQVQPEGNITGLRHLAKEFKVIKTFAIISGVLICCFSPFIITSLTCSFDTTCPHILYKINTQVVGINSIINAYIYALRHKKYRKAFKDLFSSLWGRFSNRYNCLSELIA